MTVCGAAFEAAVFTSIKDLCAHIKSHLRTMSKWCKIQQTFSERFFVYTKLDLILDFFLLKTFLGKKKYYYNYLADLARPTNIHGTDMIHESEEKIVI